MYLNKYRVLRLVNRYNEGKCDEYFFFMECEKIFTVVLKETMEYFDNCSPYEFQTICPVFGDISEFWDSKELIECMERNAKRTGVDCKEILDYARYWLRDDDLLED